MDYDKQLIEIVRPTKESDINLLSDRFEINKNVYMITIGGKLCGVIEFHVPYEYSLKIEYIEVFNNYRGKGIARRVIEKLRLEHPGHEIYGDSLPIQSTLNFWSKLGAEIEFEMDIDAYEANCECIPFTIH